MKISCEVTHPCPAPARLSISTSIALGVQYINSKYMLHRDFVDIAKQITMNLNLQTQWLGIPYASIQTDGESHLRLGLIVKATMKSGHLIGWLRRAHRIGADTVLYAPDDAPHEWSLVRVGDGAFKELGSVGQFEISKIDTLQSVLFTQAPSPTTAHLSDYIELPRDPVIEICQEPSRGFFSYAHIRYVKQKAQANSNHSSP